MTVPTAYLHIAEREGTHSQQLDGMVVWRSHGDEGWRNIEEMCEYLCFVSGMTEHSVLGEWGTLRPIRRTSS